MFALLDFLAQLISGMDGIGETVAILDELSHNEKVTGFEIPDSAGWSSWRVTREFRAAGIPVYGLVWRPWGLRFSVREQDADLAEAILTGHYVPPKPQKSNYR